MFVWYLFKGSYLPHRVSVPWACRLDKKWLLGNPGWFQKPPSTSALFITVAKLVQCPALSEPHHSTAWIRAAGLLIIVLQVLVTGLKLREERGLTLITIIREARTTTLKMSQCQILCSL